MNLQSDLTNEDGEVSLSFVFDDDTRQAYCSPSISWTPVHNSVSYAFICYSLDHEKATKDTGLVRTVFDRSVKDDVHWLLQYVPNDICYIPNMQANPMASTLTFSNERTRDEQILLRQGKCRTYTDGAGTGFLINPNMSHRKVRCIVRGYALDINLSRAKSMFAYEFLQTIRGHVLQSTSLEAWHLPSESRQLQMNQRHQQKIGGSGGGGGPGLLPNGATNRVFNINQCRPCHK